LLAYGSMSSVFSHVVIENFIIFDFFCILGMADVEEEAKGKKNSIHVKNPPGGKSSGPFW